MCSHIFPHVHRHPPAKYMFMDTVHESWYKQSENLFEDVTCTQGLWWALVNMVMNLRVP